MAGVATAIGISFDPKALADWQTSHGGEGRPAAPMSGLVLGLVMAQYPGAIKVN